MPTVCFRCDDEEYADLAARASAARTTASTIVREALWPVEDSGVKAEIKAIRAALAGAGIEVKDGKW